MNGAQPELAAKLRKLEETLALAQCNRATRRKAGLKVPQTRAVAIAQAQIDRLLNEAFPDGVPS